MKDTYKSITKPSDEALFKDKGSKFFGYAFPISNVDQVKDYVEELKKQHHNARHWCYAYQLGTINTSFRVNDDGEPNNSAGMPIYGQIQAFEITNVLIIVVRYFGGTKLGVSGLINAYKTAAKLALENSDIKEYTITFSLRVQCDYDSLNYVMRLFKEHNLTIAKQQMDLKCKILLKVRLKEVERIFNKLAQFHKLEVEIQES